MQNFYRYNIHLKQKIIHHYQCQLSSAALYSLSLSCPLLTTLPLHKHACLSLCARVCVCVWVQCPIRHFGAANRMAAARCPIGETFLSILFFLNRRHRTGRCCMGAFKSPFVMISWVASVVVVVLWECFHILMKGYSGQSQPSVVVIVSPMST